MEKFRPHSQDPNLDSIAIKLRLGLSKKVIFLVYIYICELAGIMSYILNK